MQILDHLEKLAIRQPIGVVPGTVRETFADRRAAFAVPVRLEVRPEAEGNAKALCSGF